MYNVRLNLTCCTSQLTAFNQSAHFDDAGMSKGMMGHVVRGCDPVSACCYFEPYRLI